MSYMDLIDIGLNVDLSGLRDTLGRIDQNVEVLTDRVKSIEDGGYPVDEDRVHDLFATYISDEGIITESDIDKKLRDVVASDDLDSLIGDYLSDNEYVNSDDFDQKVRDLAHEEGVLTADSLESSTPFSDLVQRVESLEGEDSESIDGLKQQVATLEKTLENGNFASDSTVEDLGERLTALTQDFDVHIKSLEEQVKAQDSAIDSQLARIEDLEKQMAAVLDRSDTALDFFGLIKQAFALLQRGA
jgi:vacuolar-type H+-ATPase subunit I/STV1